VLILISVCDDSRGSSLGKAFHDVWQIGRKWQLAAIEAQG